MSLCFKLFVGKSHLKTIIANNAVRLSDKQAKTEEQILHMHLNVNLQLYYVS